MVRNKKNKTVSPSRCVRMVAFDLGFDSQVLPVFSHLRSSAESIGPTLRSTPVTHFRASVWLKVQLLFSHRRMSFYCRCEKRCSPARQAVITCRCHPEDDDHISNEDMADRRSSSRLPEAHYGMLGALCCVIRGLPASQSPSFGCRRWAACELWSSLAELESVWRIYRELIGAGKPF